MRYVVLCAALLCGIALRKRIGDQYRFLYRAQALVLGAPLALIAGWAFSWRSTSVVSLVCLLATELLVIALAIRLARRGTLAPVTAMGATSNSGFWSTPIAGALFGPIGAAFAVVYDIVGAIRPFLIVRTLRRWAPQAPSRGSALIDYLPATALVAGLALQTIGSVPAGAEVLLPDLALAAGLIGFFALGAAMPEKLPSADDFAAALPVIPLRFVAPFVTLLLLRAAGIEVPDAAWVVALAPNAFLAIALARLYGYDRARAAAVPLLAVPLAACLVPLAALMARS